jgi:hypothetical protein
VDCQAIRNDHGLAVMPPDPRAGIDYSPENRRPDSPRTRTGLRPEAPLDKVVVEAERKSRYRLVASRRSSTMAALTMDLSRRLYAIEQTSDPSRRITASIQVRRNRPEEIQSAATGVISQNSDQG